MDNNVLKAFSQKDIRTLALSISLYLESDDDHNKPSISPFFDPSQRSRSDTKHKSTMIENYIKKYPETNSKYIEGNGSGPFQGGSNLFNQYFLQSTLDMDIDMDIDADVDADKKTLSIFEAYIYLLYCLPTDTIENISTPDFQYIKGNPADQISNRIPTFWTDYRDIFTNSAKIKRIRRHLKTEPESLSYADKKELFNFFRMFLVVVPVHIDIPGWILGQVATEEQIYLRKQIETSIFANSLFIFSKFLNFPPYSSQLNDNPSKTELIDYSIYSSFEELPFVACSFLVSPPTLDNIENNQFLPYAATIQAFGTSLTRLNDSLSEISSFGSLDHMDRSISDSSDSPELDNDAIMYFKRYGISENYSNYINHLPINWWYVEKNIKDADLDQILNPFSPIQLPGGPGASVDNHESEMINDVIAGSDIFKYSNLSISADNTLEIEHATLIPHTIFINSIFEDVWHEKSVHFI